MDQPLGGTYTPETLARRRKLAEVYAQRAIGRPAQNVGEGLAAVGAALAARGINNEADEQEAAGRESAQRLFDALQTGERTEGPAGVDGRLLGAASNAFLSDGQKAIVNALIQRDFGAQDAATANAEFDRRQAMGHEQDMNLLGQRNAFTAEQNALDRTSAADIAASRTAGQGKYYAVQTGSGTMLVDKGTGRAAMLGIAEDGSPTQIGQWFQPALTAQGQPLPVPQDSIGSTPPIGGQAPGGGVEGPVGTRGAAPGARPLLAPSIDPEAQAAVTEAKGLATANVERQKNRPKVEAAFSDFQRQAQIVDESIERAIEQAGGLTTGLGSLTSGVPGTPAHDLLNTLNTIQANVGFDKLQAMRDNSPTGGALGQVSEFENRLLQSVKGALQQSQSRDQLVQNLRSVQADYKALLAEREQALATDFNVDAAVTNTDAESPLTPEEQAELEALRREFGR